MSKEIKIDENSYLMLLNKVLQNKEEERDLALDRYRKADEAIQTNEHFMLLGKNSAAFLTIASNATNDLANLAKEIKSIIFRETDKSGVGGAVQSDAEMRALIDLAKAEEASNNPVKPEDLIEPEDTENQ